MLNIQFKLATTAAINANAKLIKLFQLVRNFKMLTQKTCKSCHYYHGYHNIHCAIYPLGISDSYCHDWRKVKTVPKIKMAIQFLSEPHNQFYRLGLLFFMLLLSGVTLFSGTQLFRTLTSPNLSKSECQLEKNIDELGTNKIALPIMKSWLNCLEEFQYLTVKEREILKSNVESLDNKNVFPLPDSILLSTNHLKEKYLREKPPLDELILKIFYLLSGFSILLLLISTLGK